eukprot:s1076_g10.t4
MVLRVVFTHDAAWPLDAAGVPGGAGRPVLVTIANHDFSAAFWSLPAPETKSADAHLVLPAWVEKLGVQQNEEAEAHLAAEEWLFSESRTSGYHQELPPHTSEWCKKVRDDLDVSPGKVAEVLFCLSGILEALQRQLQRLPPLAMLTPSGQHWAAVRLMGEVYVFKAEEWWAMYISMTVLKICTEDTDEKRLKALLRKSPLVLCEGGPPGHELPGFFQFLQRSWSSTLGGEVFFLPLVELLWETLPRKGLPQTVEPHAEVTWLRPAEIWSRYLGESEETLLMISLAATLLTLLDGIDAPGRSSRLGLAICATSRRPAEHLDPRPSHPCRPELKQQILQGTEGCWPQELRQLAMAAAFAADPWEPVAWENTGRGGMAGEEGRWRFGRRCSYGSAIGRGGSVTAGARWKQSTAVYSLHLVCGGVGALATEHPEPAPGKRLDPPTCRSRILQRWLGLFRAGEGHRLQLTVLKARVWNAWLGRTIHSMEVAHQRISHGIARRKGFLLQAAISWWVLALEKIREFKVLVPVLMDTLSEACLAHGQRQMYGAWRRWWRWVEEGRRADDEELLYISFHSWWNGSVEQRHKRGVHLLCERYRDVRMKRKTLFAWKRRVERLSSVMNSVELWAANSFSQHALRVLAAWHSTCRRRLRARQGQQLLMQRRRAALLNSWHLLMLRNITAEGVAEAVLQSRALQWLRAWKAWAFAHARRRESDEVKTAFVRQSRQRWGIERWCSAGRFRRLVDVAEKWDGQVLCKQLVVRAFTGWSAMMGLYACGEKVAAAVGARRAKRMLRQWSFLLLVGEKRPHQLMRQIMARWRLFLQRCSEVQRGLERLGRWTMGPTFRRFVAYVQDRKQRRQNVSTHGSRLQSSGQRRAQASALTWWRRCVRETGDSSPCRAVCIAEAAPKNEGVAAGCTTPLDIQQGLRGRDRIRPGLGEAGSNQDGSGWIATLFAPDAVYIERIFDTRSTYRGREAIKEYWETQVIGKQSNIQFRHVVNDMVLDPEKRKAMVKWLAEFDNVRYRVPEKEKRVRFVQVAILEFSEDVKELKVLEEYMSHGSHGHKSWEEMMDNH